MRGYARSIKFRYLDCFRLHFVVLAHAGGGRGRRFLRISRPVFVPLSLTYVMYVEQSLTCRMHEKKTRHHGAGAIFCRATGPCEGAIETADA